MRLPATPVLVLAQIAQKFLQLRDLPCLRIVLRHEMRLDFRALVKDRLSVLVGLLGPPIGCFGLNVLAHYDDGEEDLLEKPCATQATITMLFPERIADGKLTRARTVNR